MSISKWILSACLMLSLTTFTVGCGSKPAEAPAEPEAIAPAEGETPAEGDTPAETETPAETP